MLCTKIVCRRCYCLMWKKKISCSFENITYLEHLHNLEKIRRRNDYHNKIICTSRKCHLFSIQVEGSKKCHDFLDKNYIKIKIRIKLHVEKK